MSKLDLLCEGDKPSLSATVQFDFDGVYHGQENTVVAMLTLTAPKVDLQVTRPPLNIVAVVDCSSSMAGKKIHNTRSSLRKLVEHLGPDDRLGIIGFHNNTFVVLPSSYMDSTTKAAATKAVASLAVDGWTNFSGALLESFQTIRRNEGRAGCVNRIIFFTDGEPTVGVQEPAQLLGMLDTALASNPDQVISLSSFGYGNDPDVELLKEMASRGRGNFFYVDEIDKCAKMFGVELGGLLSTYAQNVRVAITTAEGVQISKVYDMGYGTSSDGSITIPDILAGEDKHLLVQLKLPSKGKAVCARPSRVIDFEIHYDHVLEAKRYTLAERGQVDYLRKQEDASKDPNPAVMDQLDLLEAADTINRVKHLADQGDLGQARSIMDSYRVSLVSESAPAMALRADLASIASSLDSSVAYRTSGRSRLMRSATAYTTHRATGSSMDAAFTNYAQDTYSSLFEGDEENPVPLAPPVPSTDG